MLDGRQSPSGDEPRRGRGRSGRRREGRRGVSAAVRLHGESTLPVPGGGSERTLSSTAAQSSGIGGGEIAGEPGARWPGAGRNCQEACGLADGAPGRETFTDSPENSRPIFDCMSADREELIFRKWEHWQHNDWPLFASWDQPWQGLCAARRPWPRRHLATRKRPGHGGRALSMWAVVK